MTPGVTFLRCVPETHHSGGPIPSGAGPGRVYYGLAYRLFDLGEWVCFGLLVVSTVGWGCFSFRLDFHGGFWFVAFRPAFSSPCSFYP